MRLKLASTR